MSKRKKAKKKPVPAAPPRKESFGKALKEALSRIDRGLVLRTGLWLLVLGGIYVLCNCLHLIFHVIVYIVAFSCLGAGYFLLSGATFAKKAFTREDLSDEMSEEEKDAMLEKLTARQAKAKKLLPPLFAVAVTLMIDIVYLNIVTWGK